MNFTICQPNPGAKLFDTRATVTPAMAKEAKWRGYDGAIRYTDQITVQERDVILTEGLGLMLVQPCRAAGWIPGQSIGVVDGARARIQATNVGLELTTIWQDIEGVGPGINPEATAAALVEHCNGWGRQLTRPGIYYGAQALLTSKELGDLVQSAYWRGQSRPVDRFGVIQEPWCGFMLLQGFYLPAKRTVIGGVVVDDDFTQPDFRGRMPWWAHV